MQRVRPIPPRPGRVLAALAVLAPLCACSEPDLVVYCSLDQVHSEKIFALFEERTGLEVRAQYDVERNKTVGMVNRLLAERDRPRADVYWNNEIANTIRLKSEGITAPYVSEQAAGIPAAFKDPEGHWTGFAARARVILYRPDLMGDQEPPPHIDAMLEPAFAAHGAMAAPLTGTTLTHWSAMWSERGERATLEWLRRGMEAGLHFGGGNADVMRRVSEGDFHWCLTDTDDAAAARRNGANVKVNYPDQAAGDPGTLLIPNTVCLIAGARHREAAKRFIDFVLGAEVEATLAASDSEQIPLRPGVRAPDHVKLPGRDFAVKEVDWAAVARDLDARRKAFEELFVQ